MKITIVTLALALMITGTSQAQTLTEALQGCSDEVDNLARLTCFDKLAKQPHKQNQSRAESKITAKELPPTAPVIPAIKVEKPQAKATSNPKKVEEFGLANKPAPNSKLSKVVAIITNVSQDPYGKLIISLDNQHVWKQSDGDSFRLKAGEQVYVEEGALNSFFLSKESVNKRIRVKRLK
ncbi:MAG: hypothetical protein ACJA13_003737 [Paraglaciecola sp.]|jgi:hypothetical protein